MASSISVREPAPRDELRRPFEQLAFDDLPERPRLAHPYYDADHEDLELRSAPFGRLRVHVVSYGRADAPPLLLLHGLMTSSYSWRYLIEPLADRYRLVAPDLPGCGRTEPAPDRRHGVAELATFVGELQEALGIEGCPAAGNSLGGLICMRRVLREPASFARLVAIHPPAVPEPRLVALHLALKLPGVAALLARVVRHDPQRWAHRNVHYHDETLKSLEEAREYGEPLASAAGARSFTRYLADALHPGALRAFVRELERRRDQRRRFPVPLQLVYAREDPTVAPEVGRRLGELLPDAELRWLAETSHFVQVDSPDRLAELLAGFLER